jgi:hypothetical protein
VHLVRRGGGATAELGSGNVRLGVLEKSLLEPLTLFICRAHFPPDHLEKIEIFESGDSCEMTPRFGEPPHSFSVFSQELPARLAVGWIHGNQPMMT